MEGQMRRPFAALCALFIASSCAFNAQDCEYRLLAGTYTEGNTSEGVYLYGFNSRTLECTLLDTAKCVNPSFVTPSQDWTHAYSVCELPDDRSGVYAFSLTDRTVDVTGFENGTGADPCNILLAGGYIITSDYTGGTLTVFGLNEDASVGERLFTFAPGTEFGQAQSHIHCAALSPDSKYIYVMDLGKDNIYFAAVSELPFPQFRVAYSFDTEEHPGPRHMVFSEDGKNAYLISELGDFITAFSCHDGELELLSHEKAYDAGGHGSADIHISPDGRFVYASHRLAGDGISVFRRDSADGSLERAGYCLTGRHPRNFAISPDGKVLLCACRDNDRIEIYSIDTESGALTFTGRTVALPAPVCLRFTR